MIPCIDRYTMIQAGICLITDGLYFTGFPFSSLLGGKRGEEGPVSGQVSGGKIRYLPVSCRACLPITVDDKFVCSWASGEGMRGWGGL